LCGAAVPTNFCPLEQFKLGDAHRDRMLPAEANVADARLFCSGMGHSVQYNSMFILEFGTIAA
jgi:hypothetical protein